jgi:hypothetical protein
MSRHNGGQGTGFASEMTLARRVRRVDFSPWPIAGRRLLSAVSGIRTTVVRPVGSTCNGPS